MEGVKQAIKSNLPRAASPAAGKRAVGLPAVKTPLRIQTRLEVNTPGDRHEREADRVADKVMRRSAADGMATPSSQTVISRKCAHCQEEEKKLQRKETTVGKEASAGKEHDHSWVEAELKSARGGGQALDQHTNKLMSQAIGADFSGVRIHNGGKAAAMNKALHAHAFTHGKDIYFNTGMYDPRSDTGRHLLAHELTHVVQQGQAPALHKKEVTEKREAGNIQRWSLGDWNPLSISIEDVVRKFMPELAEIQHAGGLAPWLENKISGAMEVMMNAVIGPVRDAAGVIANLSPTMAKIITWIQTAGAKIAKNDCSSFTELGAMVERLADELAAPAIEKIKQFTGKASAWCSEMWQKFGLPVWDFIKQYVGDQWEMIKGLGNTIWEKTQPVRDWAMSVWVRFKNWLGIGEGPDGQNGILQWVEQKIMAAWNKIREKIEPFKKQLMVVGGILVLLSPAGPLIAGGAILAGIIVAVRWVMANIHSPADMVKLRVKFEKEILPQIMRGLTTASGSLKKIFGSLTDKFNSVLGAMGKLVGLVAGSILSFIQSALQWVTDKFSALVEWASVKLTELGNWLQGVFEKVASFIAPIIRFFEKVATVVGNIMELPLLFIGGLWDMVPACIRKAVEDFLINTILKNIPFFQEIVTFIKYWQKIKAGVMDVIKTVFVKGDLKGGILKAFKLLLNVLGIPVKLVVSIYQKALGAYDQIVHKPAILFGNIVEAIKIGFGNFSKNFLKNSVDALGNWIFSKVKDIKMPKDFDLPSIFGLVTDILGLTEDNIFKRIERKTSKPFADKLRKGYQALQTGARWVVDLLKDPKSAYLKIKDRVKGMKTKLFSSIGSWIAGNIIGKFTARIAAEMATSPFGEAVEAIIDAYKMISTAIEYAEKILRIVDSALDNIADLAAGKLTKAVATVEKGLSFGLEIAVAFIARIVGIGDLPVQVKKIVNEDIRPLVDSAIDSVIDLVISAVKAIKGFIDESARKAKDALFDWLGIRKIFKDARKETHKIYFEKNGNLMVASEPTDISLFLLNQKTINSKNPAMLQTVQSAQQSVQTINGMIEKIKATQNLEANKDASAMKYRELDAEITRLAGLLSILTGELRPSGKTSDPLDAIPMTWYKPIKLYPQTITLNGESYSIYEQKGLRVPRAKALKNIRGNADDIANEEIMIGLSPSSIYAPVIGKVWARNAAGALRGGPVQDQFRTLLKMSGYDGFISGSMEADHVRDLQWGGQDAYNNLWPLERSYNNAANAILRQEIVYEDASGNVGPPVQLQNTPLGLYFRIKDTI
jgi:hypothetical protein